MKKIKILQQLLFLLILVIILIFNIKIVKCDEIRMLSPEMEIEMIIKLKIEIKEFLIDVMKKESFEQKYGGGPFFNMLYFTPNFVTIFVDNLPIKDILLANRRANGADITNIILNLFVEKITHNKYIFGNSFFLISNLVVIAHDIKLTFEMKNILNTFFLIHPESTEAIGIITESVKQQANYFISQITDRKLVKCGIFISIEPSSTPSKYCDIYFSYLYPVYDFFVSVKFPLFNNEPLAMSNVSVQIIPRK